MTNKRSLLMSYPNTSKFVSSQLWRGAAKFAFSCGAFTLLACLTITTPQALANEPEIVGTNAAGSFLAARIADAEFDFETAARLLEDAIEFEPEEDNLKQALMITLLQAGHFDKAVELAEPYIRDEMRGRIARQIMFTNYVRSKKYNAAQGLLSIEPATDDMAVEMVTDKILEAWTLAGQELLDEALALLDQETEYGWHPIFTNYHAALMLEQAGRLEEAEQRYVNMIEQPRAAATAIDTVLRAFDALIRINLSQAALDKAGTALNEALKIGPNYEPFIELIDKLEAHEGETQTHIPYIETVQQGVAELFFNITKAIDHEGNEIYVSQSYQLGLALAPENALLRMALGNTFEKKERFEQANAQYEAIDDTSVHKTYALIQKAINLNSADQLDASIETLKQALERDSNNLNAALALSSIMMNADLHKDALEVLNTSIDKIERLEPAHWIMLYRAGIALDELDRWEEAEKNFLDALDLAPNQPDVLNYLGYTWVDMGLNLDKGLDMLRMAVDMRPNAGYIIDSLGWAHYRLENYDEAVNYLEQAVIITPTDPTIVDHLGDAYWQIGRKLEAKYKWKQALELEPSDEQIQNLNEKLENGLTIKFLEKSN